MPIFFIYTVIYICIFLGSIYTQVQDTLKPLDIINKIDNSLKYPIGINHYQIGLIQENYHTKIYKILQYNNEENILFSFKLVPQGKEFLILYNQDSIFSYNVFNNNLKERKQDAIFKSILKTKFNFIDLADADFSSKYSFEFYNVPHKPTADFQTYEEKNTNLISLIGKPIKYSQYSQVILHVNKTKNYELDSIDYYNQNKELVKRAEFTFDNIVSIDNTQNPTTAYIYKPKKILMRHLPSNQVNQLEFLFHKQKDIQNNFFLEIFPLQTKINNTIILRD